jgi:hypothetical protein
MATPPRLHGYISPPAWLHLPACMATSPRLHGHISPPAWLHLPACIVHLPACMATCVYSDSTPRMLYTPGAGVGASRGLGIETAVEQGGIRVPAISACMATWICTPFALHPGRLVPAPPTRARAPLRLHGRGLSESIPLQGYTGLGLRRHGLIPLQGYTGLGLGRHGSIPRLLGQPRGANQA